MKMWKVNWSAIKDVRANCFCASLLRTQIHIPRHASSARAKYLTNFYFNNEVLDITNDILCPGQSYSKTVWNKTSI